MYRVASIVTLYRPEAATTVPSIAWTEFVAATMRYAKEISQRSFDDATPSALPYAVLTMCRALRTVRTQAHGSKQEAVAWTAEQMPEWAGLLDEVLYCRLSGGASGLADERTRAAAARLIGLVADQISGTCRGNGPDRLRSGRAVSAADEHGPGHPGRGMTGQVAHEWVRARRVERDPHHRRGARLDDRFLRSQARHLERRKHQIVALRAEVCQMDLEGLAGPDIDPVGREAHVLHDHVDPHHRGRTCRFRWLAAVHKGRDGDDADDRTAPPSAHHRPPSPDRAPGNEIIAASAIA